MASSTITNGKSSRPPQPATGTAVNTITLQADGTATLGNGTVISSDGVTSLLQQLAAQKKIIILPADQDGLSLFNAGIHGLTSAVTSQQYTQAPGFLSQVHRGLHDLAGIGTPNMTAPDKVPPQAGLPEAGHSAVVVLGKYPNPAFNALVRLNVGQLDAQTDSLDVHNQLAQVYSAAATRVSLGIGYLSALVWDGSHLVYSAIQPALPVDEDLVKDAKPLTDYFDAPVEQAQKTKKLLKKQKSQVTTDVTNTVKDQALQQAKAELQSEINAKVGPIFSGNNGLSGSSASGSST